MSSYSNITMLTVRLTKDANIRKNRDNTHSAFLPLADDNYYKDQNGKLHQHTNWLCARAFLKTDKQVNFYKKLTKGKQIRIVGTVQGHSWKVGNVTHYRQDIVPDNNGITIITPKSQSNSDSKPAQSAAPKAAQKSAAPKSAAPKAKNTVSINDDDLPF